MTSCTGAVLPEAAPERTVQASRPSTRLGGGLAEKSGDFGSTMPVGNSIESPMSQTIRLSLGPCQPSQQSGPIGDSASENAGSVELPRRRSHVPAPD
jgi:hypothetical protein